MTKFLSQAMWCCFVLAAITHLSIAPAHAYLDPTMGSYTIQALAGGALASGYMLRRYWSWLKLKITQLSGGCTPPQGARTR